MVQPVFRLPTDVWIVMKPVSVVEGSSMGVYVDQRVSDLALFLNITQQSTRLARLTTVDVGNHCKSVVVVVVVSSSPEAEYWATGEAKAEST